MPKSLSSVSRTRLGVYQYIVAGARQGMSGAATLRAIREAGIGGIRTQTFYQDFNYAKSYPLNAPGITPQNPAWYGVPVQPFKSPSKKRRAYQHLFNIVVSNPKTQEKTTWFNQSTITFEQQNPEQAFNDYAEGFSDRYPSVELIKDESVYLYPKLWSPTA